MHPPPPEGSVIAISRRMPLRPIGYIDLWLTEEAVAKTAPDWLVELNGTETEDASVVIMPDGADDLIGPTFILYQLHEAYRLDQFQWDIITRVGSFASVHEALRTLAGALHQISSSPPIRSRLRH
jgi:hypothetical protein